MKDIRNSETIEIAVQEFKKLKKSNLTDRQIRKIAQIFLAFTANDLQWPN